MTGFSGKTITCAALPVVRARAESCGLAPKRRAVGVDQVQVERIVVIGRAGHPFGLAPGRGDDRLRPGLVQLDALQCAALCPGLRAVAANQRRLLPLETFLIGAPRLGMEQIPTRRLGPNDRLDDHRPRALAGPRDRPDNPDQPNSGRSAHGRTPRWFGNDSVRPVPGRDLRHYPPATPARQEFPYAGTCHIINRAQSPIPNPQSPIPNPQSPIPNPQSPIPNPQSPIPNPQSPIPNPQSPR